MIHQQQMSSSVRSEAGCRPRIFRVHGSQYHHDEIMEASTTHTDERLAEIAAMGFDGVWLHANLKWLAPTSLFESHVDRVAERVASLIETVQRAKQHGIGVWLYLNEPRSFPADHPFWAEHPECRGHHHNDNRWDIGWPWAFKRQPCFTLCLSAKPVVDFLCQATESLLRQVPDLAGIITITNSEHPTHCYSKLGISKPTGCPRCASRPRVEMPLTVLRAMAEGMRAADSAAQLAAWTWSWSSLAPDPQQELLDGLPAEIVLISDYERGEPVERAGVRFEVDEYAFATAGPSQRFSLYHRACGQREIWAKLQIGTTHELATMPNIPALSCLYDKIANMRRDGVRGALATWTMGLRPTVNSFVAGRLLASVGQLPDKETALIELAMDYFDIGQAAARNVVHAWNQFSDAIRYFPTTMAFCYYSPVNYAPAYPWKLQRDGTPMARSWTPEPWGDKLEQSLGSLTMAQVIRLLDELTLRWNRGIAPYRIALADGNARARQKLSVAEACGVFYESCRGAYRFALAAEQGCSNVVLADLIRGEIALCARAIQLLKDDDRLGWHDDCGWMIRPALVESKVASLKRMLSDIRVPA